MFALATSLSAQGPEVGPLAAALSKSISASGRKTAAVVDFTDLQGCVTELGRYLAEDLSVGLASDARGFEVIDRTNLKVILQEHHLASTGIIDPETARKLGQIAGVDTLVTGTIAPLGDVIHVSAKALDTNAAMILGL
jgi:curli biogenesis system outer membrane secretion channel CsgG